MDAHEQLTAMEARVLGALIEKAGTTPDSYPLTTNALIAACNQSTNRDPVVSYSEREIDQTMLELRQRGLARTLSGAGHRVPKHRHVVDEAMDVDSEALAVLAVLLLRGAQTLNEVSTRTERYTDGPEGSSERADAAIDRLAQRTEPLVVRLERRPGEREPRIDQLWAQGPVLDAAPAEAPTSDGREATPAPPTAGARVDELEAELAALRARVERLESELGL